MEGILYKKGKHIPSWNERYFVLKNITLAYYQKAGDRQSRGMLILAPECKASDIDISKRKAHKPLYSFIVTWPQRLKGKHYQHNDYAIQLGCETKEVADAWKTAIENAIELSSSLACSESPLSIEHIEPEVSSVEIATPVLLLNAMEKSLAMFTGKWEISGIIGGLPIWQEKIKENDSSYSLLSLNRNSLLVITSIFTTVAVICSLSGRSSGLLSSLLILSLTYLIFCTSPDNKALISRSFKASQVIRSSPQEVFDILMDIKNCANWNGAVESAKVIQSIDRHSDVIHVMFKPVWIFPFWLPPRDLCLMRYWRHEDDGSFVICIQSAIHPECKPKAPYVRASCNGGGYTIAPRSRTLTSSDDSDSLVTHVIQTDPTGLEKRFLLFSGQLLNFIAPQLLSLIGLQNVVEESKFVQVRCLNEKVRYSDGDSSDQQSIESNILQNDEELQGNVPKEYWCEPDPGLMLVRGPGYIFDHLKIPSAPPAFKLLACDLYRTECAVEHIASHPDTLLPKRLALYKERNEEMPFMFIINIIVPGPPNMCLVFYYTTVGNVLQEDTPFAELFRNFLERDNDYRDERFKLIPCIIEGNFIVRQAVGSTPAIIGKKLRQPYFKGQNYFELDIDICSSAVANRVTGLVQGYTKKLTLDLGFLLQGNTAEELPERLFGSIRLKNIDLACAQPLRRYPSL